MHRWRAAGQGVALSRVVAVSGLGSSLTTRALAVSADGAVSGEVLDTAVNAHVLPLMQQAP